MSFAFDYSQALMDLPGQIQQIYLFYHLGFFKVRLLEDLDFLANLATRPKVLFRRLGGISKKTNYLAEWLSSFG